MYFWELIFINTFWHTLLFAPKMFGIYFRQNFRFLKIRDGIRELKSWPILKFLSQIRISEK